MHQWSRSLDLIQPTPLKINGLSLIAMETENLHQIFSSKKLSQRLVGYKYFYIANNFFFFIYYIDFAFHVLTCLSLPFFPPPPLHPFVCFSWWKQQGVQRVMNVPTIKYTSIEAFLPVRKSIFFNAPTPNSGFSFQHSFIPEFPN